MSYTAFSEDGINWGVEENGAILYEADFDQDSAEAIAEMENGDNPPADWFETEERLARRGLHAIFLPTVEQGEGR